MNQDRPLLRKKHVEGFALSHNQISPDFIDTFGHGTAIYAILHSVSDFADILNIKIPGIESHISEGELLSAVTYIAENVPCDLLNLSFGLNVCRELQRFRKICNELNKRGGSILCRKWIVSK